MKPRLQVVNTLLSSLLACFVAFGSPVAGASTNTTEITDMWYNPSESGWGVNIVLQNNVAFMTFFVYDADRKPVWFTAELRFVDSFVWSGPLYVTSGPWFGGPFPQASVTARQAGVASFSMSATDLNQAVLTYIVDGVSVVRSVRRQFWTYENFSGTYAGGYSLRATGCQPRSRDGIEEINGVLDVTQNGTSISMNATTAGFSCSFVGTYSQQGKLGRVDGSYSCTDARVGTFTMSDMTPTVSGFTGRVAGQNQFCQWSGYVGGIARQQ